MIAAKKINDPLSLAAEERWRKGVNHERTEVC